MPLYLLNEDIVTINADAIVNAANEFLSPGGGVCGRIFQCAGHSDLQRACARIGRCPVGSAVITPAFKLLAKHIIHAVGPIYFDGTRGEEKLLRSAYDSALRLANENGCKSIAFPLISGGIFRYPIKDALKVAINAINRFLREENSDMFVYMVLLNNEALDISRKLINFCETYDQVDESPSFINIREETEVTALHCELPDEFKGQESVMHDVIGSLKGEIDYYDLGFSKKFSKKFAESSLSIKELSQKSNVTTAIIKKILETPDYIPNKDLIITFGIAFEMDFESVREVLKQFGYDFSPRVHRDRIFEYFMTNKIFDVSITNQSLFYYNEKMLGLPYML